MKKSLVAFALLFVTSAPAAFIELKSVSEFEALVQTSGVPVVVQFEAYWCGPCQSLKAAFRRIAPNYNDNQVRLAHVDAYVNSSLQSYLQGGYPTVRTFSNGQLASASFVGSQSDSEVRSFVDGVIAGSEVELPKGALRAGASCPLNEF